MKKKFKLQDLDCANCAAKMEDAIKKLPSPRRREAARRAAAAA